MDSIISITKKTIVNQIDFDIIQQKFIKKDVEIINKHTKNNVYIQNIKI